MKLRGFRIELGEVEAVLMEAPGVKLAAAIVMKDPSATDRLVGFVSPDTVDSEAIVAELRQRLPAHFVPSLIVPLAEMPLSPAGKVCPHASIILAVPAQGDRKQSDKHPFNHCRQVDVVPDLAL